MRRRLGRRQILRAGLGVGASGLAGCAGTPSLDRSDGPTETRSPESTTPSTREITRRPTTPEQRATADDAPVLRHLGVTFSGLDEQTGMAGDFRFSEEVFELEKLYPTTGDKVFVEFGGRIVTERGVKRSPEFGYIVARETMVRSAIDGVVTHVETMYSGDVAITTAARQESAWMVSHEHVSNPLVEVGDEVEVGQPIADVSTVDLEGTGFGWTELAVWKGGATPRDIVKRCPFSALAEDRKTAIGPRIDAFVRDWEAFVGKDVYDAGSWVATGCRFESLTEAETVLPGE